MQIFLPYDVDCLGEQVLSVLFLGYVAARKRTKKNGVFSGRCPEPQSLFEKSDTKTFMSWLVRAYCASFWMRILSASMAVRMALSVSCCSADSSSLSMPRLALS